MLWKGTKTDYLKIIGEREDPQENCLNKVIGILYDLDLYQAYPEIETHCTGIKVIERPRQIIIK